MEAGRVVGKTLTGFYPASIGWLPASLPASRRGFDDSVFSDPLAPVRLGGVFSKRPRFPAWRSSACKIVEFEYGEAASPA